MVTKSYRKKVYVCFDLETDQTYYEMMKDWRQKDGSPFDLHTMYDLDNEEEGEKAIRGLIRDQLEECKMLVVLVGRKTRYSRSVVLLEMEEAVKMDVPIIVLNINGARQRDGERCTPVLRNELVMHIGFHPAIVEYALKNWTKSHKKHRKENDIKPYYYSKAIYKKVGL